MRKTIMTTMTSVQPAAPVAPWLGGKKALHKTLIERIEQIPHKTYIEPFVGRRLLDERRDRGTSEELSEWYQAAPWQRQEA